ncbi:uncharacterized protein FFB20_05668 [Fusarium fujikuroi]|nr:uncharacterized protein FFB20_05668 [Fusarium fujikuroi]SCO10992.1 uncharacterized protein FFC1_11317 [Fusarium fujikuroi]SCO13450.1 uncharacterized protein FFE2_12825 [Fusarium fujikuroi]SCO18113.1 uncharacterized protein FFM5_11749 [Fusarium fujikuroi]SCO40918.1 uncharacterized protein FFNC_07761 [Fusarium fujikuroi]
MLSALRPGTVHPLLVVIPALALVLSLLLRPLIVVVGHFSNPGPSTLKSVPATHDEPELKVEVKSESNEKSLYELFTSCSFDPPAPTHTTLGASIKKKLADPEKQLLITRKGQQRKTESME